MSEPAHAPLTPPHLSTGARGIRIVMNAGSGSGETEERVAALKAAFAKHPATFHLELVRKGGSIADAAAAAARQDGDTVVAAGGDGTIIAVAQALVGTDKKLGVLPFGTFNYFARSLDLPQDVDAALQVVMDGRTKSIHVGEVNGKLFINNASLGAYAAILHDREQVYRRWGRSRLVAYWSVLTTLARFRKPLALKVTVDDEVRRVSTPLVFVANNVHQLEAFDLAGADCVRGGRFALFIAPDCSRLEMIKYAMRLAFRAMEPDRDYELICGREILVESRKSRRLVARDGEREAMTAPFHFVHRPDAIEVLVPAAA